MPGPAALGDKVGRLWGGKCGMQLIVVLRGHRTTGVNLNKHLNLIPTPFWSKSPSAVITTYKIFMPLFYVLNQPVKFSHKSY